MSPPQRTILKRFKKNFALPLAFILLVVFIVMNIFQMKLDKSRRISLHCYIRNVAIVFTIYYLRKYKWNWSIFALPFIVEMIIEIAHTYNFFSVRSRGE